MRKPYVENFLALGNLCCDAMQYLHCATGLSRERQVVDMKNLIPLREHIRDVARREDRDEIERETKILIQRLDEHFVSMFGVAVDYGNSLRDLEQHMASDKR